MEWLAFFSQPITQAGGLIAVLIGLHKSGIVNVKGLVRGALGLDQGVKEINGDNRDALQTLLMQMEKLTQYANHDTSESLEKLHTKADEASRVNDKLLYVLDDIKNNGVKCRGE